VRLTTTTFAVLGLLTFREMSGYDVLKLAQRSIAHFWSPARSHVYAELKRLSALGLASERHVAQEGRPDKTIYAITDDGMRALREWMSDAEVEPDQLKSPFTLKVFFGALLPAESLVVQIKEMRRQAQQQLEELRATELEIGDDERLFFPYLTLRAGLAHTQAELRWADEVIDELDRRGER
jgi:PadR family transcriptional regulator AphA